MSAYDDLLQGFAQEDQKKNRLASSLSEAAVTNPDEFANMVKLSKAASISLESIPDYKEEAEQAKYLGEVGFATLWKDAPKTSEFLSDPTNAKLARDDVGNLSGIESAFRFLKDSGNALKSGIYGMNAGLVGFAQAPFDLAAPLLDPLAGRIIPENPLRRASAGLSEYRQGIDATAKHYMPKGDGNVEQGWYSGLASLSRNLTTMPLAFVPGGQPAALAGMTVPVFGEEYGKARDKGLGPVNSAVYGSSQAAIEYATEKLPLSRLVGDVKAGEAFLKILGRQAAAEVPGEQIATVLQDMNEWAVINPDKPFSAYVAERPGAAVQTLVATLVGVGGQTTVVKGVESAVSFVEGRKQKAELSEQGSKLIEDLNKLAAANKLLSRDPETFQQFVAQAAEDGPVQQVFIDANTLMQSGVAEQIAAVSPAVAEQLQTAVAIGGQIAIPVDEYAAKIAPTEYAQSLVDHLKTEADGFSRAEAQEYMQSGAAQELEAEVQRILADKEGDDTFKASADVVRQNIKGQLDTAARFTPQVNDAYSSMVGNFYAVQAARLGTTPEELFNRYPLKVGAERIVGQQFEQGDIIDSAPYVDDPRHIAAMRSYFEKNGVVVNDDNTVTLWHTTSPSNVKKIIDEGVFKGGATATGGMSGLALEPSAFFGTDRDWVENTWGGSNGKDGVIEVRVPVQYLRHGAQNFKEIYFEGGLKRDGDVWKPVRLRSTFVDRLANKRFGAPDLNNQLNQSPIVNPIEEKAPNSLNRTRPANKAAGSSDEDAFNQSIDDDVNDINIRLLTQGEQSPRGSFNPATLSITLLKNADLSTFLHESGHFFLEVQFDIAAKLQQEAKAFGRDTLKPGEQQAIDDADALLRWFGVGSLDEWFGLDFEEKRSYHEKFARGFESYLFEGKAPAIELQGMFQRFRAWLVNVYRDIKNLNVELTDEVRGVMDRMLATNEQIALAEQGRSMIPLFTSAEQAGMTVEEFAAYQALDVDSTNEAIQDLQSRGLRDMQWLHNARGRIIKKLQRESKEQRAAVEMDARREVMRQPIYRAWQFLTAKQTRDDLVDSEKARADYREALSAWNALRKAAEEEARSDAKQDAWSSSEEGQKKYRKDGALAKAQQKVLRREESAIDSAVEKVMAEWESKNPKPNDPDSRPKSSPDVVDPTRDSLFAAIGKLGGINKAELVGAWGIDPADKPQSGVFAKPVWRIDSGMSIDGMAEALSQYGYLPVDENGKWDIRDLEEKFKSELGGDVQLSSSYDYSADQADETISNPGGLTAGRFDIAALSSMGFPAEVINAIKARKMTAKTGLHPDVVAELFDFTSGDELVRKLAAVDTPKDAINALTDAMMLEQYGDLSSQEAIEQAADKAIHNEARARMIAAEANALAKAIGATEQVGTNKNGKPVMRPILPRAAKEFAESMIARLKVRNVKPGQYANAEVRAGKAAKKASEAGDIATAAAEKRNQLINTYATRAAHDALDAVNAGLRYLKRFEGKVKGLDSDYIDQIDTLLERFDLRKGQSLKAIDKRKSFSAWLAAQREAGLEPDIPESLENESYRVSYKDMTVEEFNGLIDTIKQIEHLGRLKNRLMTARDEREFAAIVAEAESSIRENGGNERPVELETPRGIKPWLDGIAAGHRKMASLLRQMDGGKDNGPMWRALGRGMNEAATNEATMIEQATMRLAEIFKPILDMKGGTTGDKRFIPAINASLTRGGRLAVALNWGNEANRQRVMDGDQWSPAQVNAILSTLSREEWSFVQNAWDFVDSYWPQIEAKEKRVTGRAPDKVQASPFSVTLADGSVVNLRGGYYPIKYDSNRDDKAEKHDAAAVADDMKRGAVTRSTTRRGHTKARVENVKRPVKKTLDVITQHVSEVTHDLAWHEWLIDANRMIDEPKINQAIRDHYGPAVIRTMKDTLQGIATADIVPQTKMDQALLYLRANVSRSTMGLSLTTAFLQPFGLTQSMVRIGAKHVLRGLARWGGDAARFKNSMEWIGEKSDFMRLRSKTFNRELHEIKNRVVNGQSKARQIYDASLFMLMQKMQMVADVPTWIGAYEKALSENHDDATAVAMADQAVLDSQGGGQTKDMAELQRKHPMLTMFYSYFNVTLNLAAESTAKTDFKNPLAVAGWLSDMALLMVVPALGPALILHLLKGGGDDDEPEEWAKRIAEWQVGYLLGTVIGVRELSGAVSGFDYAGPPAGRIIADLGKLKKQAEQGDLDEGLAISSVQVMGAATGIPTVQIIRSWRGWNAWSEGDAPPTSILLGPPPKD